MTALLTPVPDNPEDLSFKDVVLSLRTNSISWMDTQLISSMHWSQRYLDLSRKRENYWDRFSNRWANRPVKPKSKLEQIKEELTDRINRRQTRIKQQRSRHEQRKA